MKQLVNTFSVIILISVFTMGMKKIFIPGKRYTVTLTQEEWGSILTNMNNAAVMIRTSSYPGNQIVQVQDTTIKYQQLIQEQLIPQINADSVKSKK